jgi:hypothetical protein
MRSLFVLLAFVLSGCIIESDGGFAPIGAYGYYDDVYEYTVGCYPDDYEYVYSEADCYPGLVSMVVCHPNWVRPGCVTPSEVRFEFGGCYLTHVCEVW